MRTFLKIAFIAGIIFASGSAWAQSSTGTTTAGANITLQGVIESSIQLVVAGTGTTTIAGGTTTTGGAFAAGTVDFGTFNTQAVRSVPGTGSIIRTTAGTAGAFAVAQLSFTATYSGNAGGADHCNVNMTMGAAGGTSPIVAGNVRMQPGTGAAWTNSADGTVLAAAAPGVSLCPSGLPAAGDCASGATYSNEVAVFVPDTQAAGNFTQVVVYSASVW